jgi:hypothetical protein
MTAVDAPRSGGAGAQGGMSPAAPMRAPNAWRASSKAERSWLSAPVQNLRGAAYFWNFIPGLGLLRVGQKLPALIAFSIGVPAVYGAGCGPFGAGVYAAVVGGCAQLMVRAQIGSIAPTMLERVAAWKWRRSCQSPDCPRCGVAPANAWGFCSHCIAMLAPYVVQPGPAVRAADGLTFPRDPALGVYVSQHLDVHTSLGSTARRDHDKLKELAEVDDRAFESHSGEFLAAYAEPLDPTVLWLRSRQSGRLHDGTVVVEELVRRARYADGRVAEVWDTTRLAFPEGRPSMRHGQAPVEVPAKIVSKMAI